MKKQNYNIFRERFIGPSLVMAAKQVLKLPTPRILDRPDGHIHTYIVFGSAHFPVSDSYKEAGYNCDSIMITPPFHPETIKKIRKAAKNNFRFDYLDAGREIVIGNELSRTILVLANVIFETPIDHITRGRIADEMMSDCEVGELHQIYTACVDIFESLDPEKTISPDQRDQLLDSGWINLLQIARERGVDLESALAGATTEEEE